MSAYSAAVLADNPTGYWRLGEASGNFADSSGNGKTMTAHGSITYGTASLIATDAANNAITPNGSTGYADSTLSTTETVPCTIEAWVQTSTTNKPGGAYFVGHTNTGCRAGIAGNPAKWEFTTKSVKNYDFTAGPTANTTYHIVFVLNTDFSVDLYINGAFSQTITGTSGPTAGGGGVEIGADNGAGFFWSGIIDEVVVYNTALSSARIAAHYAAATSASAGSQNMLLLGVG